MGYFYGVSRRTEIGGRRVRGSAPGSRASSGTTWEPALATRDASSEPHGSANLIRGGPSTGFSHAIQTWATWQASPMSDQYLGRMALSVVTSMGFGAPGRTDFLAVSFSALSTSSDTLTGPTATKSRT